MKEIKLTQGKVALVDDEDFEYLNQWKWRWADRYVVRSSLTICGKRHTIFIHREIMKTPHDLVCDHINHNTLDNQKNNLRNVSGLENHLNRRSHKNNKSGYKGVSKHGSGWRAFVDLDGKHVFVKTYKTALEAAHAYDREALKFHGEFASINFPKK